MIWKTSKRTFDLNARGVIFGILNVTPDSFSDGGDHASMDAAIAHGLQMAKEGAEVIDVGGESTRPGAVTLSAAEEMRRVIPVIEQLSMQTSAALSIDTSKAIVARAAIAAGAEIINDITALRGDAAMMDVAAEAGAGVVLMHMQGTPCTMQEAPHYDHAVHEVATFLRDRAEAALAAGVASEHIAVDPGIGFGKTPEHNWQLIAGLGELAQLPYPVMLGASRKSFLASAISNAGREERDFATAGLTAFGRTLGVRLFRVHAVRANLCALRAVETALM